MRRGLVILCLWLCGVGFSGCSNGCAEHRHGDGDPAGHHEHDGDDHDHDGEHHEKDGDAGEHDDRKGRHDGDNDSGDHRG